MRAEKAIFLRGGGEWPGNPGSKQFYLMLKVLSYFSKKRGK